jgi:hypothetical protein
VQTSITATLGVLVWTTVSSVYAQAPEDARDLKLLRFEVDNDAFVDSDGALTSAWSLQLHSPLFDKWPGAFERRVGLIPGLGDDGTGGRVVRRALGVTQLMITPKNITIARPQPDDVPWAGLLGAYVSWSSYDNDRLAALQGYVGCIGSCSYAEEVQKLFHDSLGRGKSPRGWPNQIADRPLLNVNYEFRRKLWTRGAFDPRGRSNDLSAGAQLGAGSFATYAQTWLEYRFGWDVPQGFTNLADPPALGIALDPVYLDPLAPATERSWRPYFSLVARVRWVDDFAPLEGGPTDNGGFHPPLQSASRDEQLLFGVHVTKVLLAFHLTYHRFLDDDHFLAVAGSELEWVSLSFERRF